MVYSHLSVTSYTYVSSGLCDRSARYSVVNCFVLDTLIIHVLPYFHNTLIQIYLFFRFSTKYVLIDYSYHREKRSRLLA